MLYIRLSRSCLGKATAVRVPVALKILTVSFGIMALASVVCVCLVLARRPAAAPLADTNEGRQFLAAFERSVRECLPEESVARVHLACDAALLCRSESATRTVEERCLEAYRSGFRMEQIVAAYVLTEWNRPVRADTLAEMKQLMRKSVPGEGTREGLKYLIEHLEKLAAEAEQESLESQEEPLVE